MIPMITWGTHVEPEKTNLQADLSALESEEAFNRHTTPPFYDRIT